MPPRFVIAAFLRRRGPRPVMPCELGGLGEMDALDGLRGQNLTYKPWKGNIPS